MNPLTKSLSVAVLALTATGSFLATKATCQPSAKTREVVQEVGLCELSEKPGAFNHKLVKVSGIVGFGFEDFAISDPTCVNSSIWLEYGGTLGSGAVYCCVDSSDRKRKKPPVIDNIAVTLTQNETFKRFDKLIHNPPDATVKATLVGRFFSGQKNEERGTWGGYGHFGCCSLLLIQDVVSVEPPNPQLDSRNSGVEDKYLENFRGYADLLDGVWAKQVLATQKTADNGIDTWRFTDHRRVVIEFLTTKLSNNAADLYLKVAEQTTGRVVYLVSSPSSKYVIVVSRPYWLSFYSKDPDKVVWVIRSAIVGH